MSLLTRSAFGNKRARGTVSTTNGSATAVKFGGSGTVVLPNNKVWHVTADIAARRTDSGTEGAGYQIKAVVQRGANAASTALVGSATTTTVGETNAGWDATIAADTTNGGFKVNVTGEAAKTVAWTCQLRLVEA